MRTILTMMTLVTALVLIGSFFAIAGVVSRVNSAEAGETTTGEDRTGAEAENRIVVGMTEFVFSKRDIPIMPGEEVTVVVVNNGSLEHNLTFGSETIVAQPGTSASATLKIDSPSVFYCSVPGHREAGMTGEFTASTGEEGVEAAGEVADADTSSGVPNEEMRAGHQAGMEAFPAETEGLGGQPLDFTLDGETKVFDLEALDVQWELAPGDVRRAFAYNGQVPGPQIRVTQGDRVQVNITNSLPEDTTLHWHGMMVPNDQDGVPFLTQEPIAPGETYTYEFTASNPGSHMYHSHFASEHQVLLGLIGAFIIDPADPAFRYDVDVDQTLILNDGPLGFSINGKAFPATAPIVAEHGERILLRLMNEGLQIHPMHTHGVAMTVVAKDGWPLAAPYTGDTVMVAPGERLDVVIDSEGMAGAWAFHCHILTHAEAPTGLNGMTTAIVVNGEAADDHLADSANALWEAAAALAPAEYYGGDAAPDDQAASTETTATTVGVTETTAGATETTAAVTETSATAGGGALLAVPAARTRSGVVRSLSAMYCPIRID